MVALDGGAATIGRAADNKVVIADQRVSSHHSVVEPETGGGHRLRDLGSRFGTMLNGQLVESAQLAQGDEIQIGPVAMVYETHAAPASVQVERRIVASPPGRHPSPNATTGASGNQTSDPAS
jgi:pSer/pThr/pTyr-binding forkhead associated (FHA) protein